MTSRVILITGASRGIGLAVARQLLQNSHRVVLTARSQAAFEGLKGEFPGQVEYATGDITDPALSKKITELAVKAFGRLDGVVVNHGSVEPIARVANANLDEWKRLYDINFFSALSLLKEAIPELRKTKGCVAWVSSGAAVSCYTAWSAYGSSKAAMNSLAGHLTVEEPDITSVCISPGRVDTEMQRVIRENGGEMREADLADFTQVFEKGELYAPETPGNAIAKFVMDPKREQSGGFFRVTPEGGLGPYAKK